MLSVMIPVLCCAWQELSITLWSFAKLEHVSVEVEELVETCAREAEGSLNTYSPMDLSNLAYACAHLRTTSVNNAPSRLMEMVIFEATPRLSEFAPQGIANFIWSMAKAGAETPEAMEAAATAADERVYSLTPQGWATILWAFAKADLPITPKVRKASDSLCFPMHYSPGLQGPLSCLVLVAGYTDETLET